MRLALEQYSPPNFQKARASEGTLSLFLSHTQTRTKKRFQSPGNEGIDLPSLVPRLPPKKRGGGGRGGGG